MRVAYVCADPGVPVFGRKGSSIHVQEILRGLIKQGARIDLFATRTGGDPDPDLRAVKVHQPPALPKGETAAREQAALANNDDLQNALAHAGAFDLVYERYSLWSFAGMEYAHAHKIPGLLEVNTPLIEEQARYRGLADRAGAERVADRVFAAASALLAVSDGVGDYLRPYAGERVHVVPNGVNPERFPPASVPPGAAHDGKFTIGFVGTLKPWHGLPVVVDALVMLYEGNRDTRLLIVGDGSERGAMEQYLKAKGLREAAHFTGAVPPHEIPALLAMMDVAVAPYPRLENFYFSPLKVFEYMAAGVPVVASRIGQLDGLITHDVNGLLCEPGDPETLAQALARLRQAPELRIRLAAAARADILEKHTWDGVTRRILELAGISSTSPHSKSRAQASRAVRTPALEAHRATAGETAETAATIESSADLENTDQPPVAARSERP